MKKVISLLVVVLVILAGVAIVSAQGTGLNGQGWWFGTQVQNVGDVDANIVATAYDAATNSQYQEPKTVAPGAAYTFTPINDFLTMPAGFQGSMVLSSDQPIKAITNITNQPVGTLGQAGGKGAAQYAGTDGSAVDTTLYFPLAKGDHFGKCSTFYIQNAGSADITGAVATFNMRNGDAHTVNLPTIGQNKMVATSVFESVTYNPTTNDGRVGGLIVTATQPMAGVVMEHDCTGNPAVVLNGTRGFTSADFDTTAYAPVIKNARFGQFTGLQVQNTGGAPIDITVTYAGTAGTCAGNSYTDSATAVAPGTSRTFVHTAGNTNLPANCTASATVVATGDFVAITNEQETAGNPKVGITSNAFAAGAATTLISVPLYKDNRFGVTTGLQIQNIGASAATNWTATFVCTGGASFTAVSDPAKTGAIQPGSAFLFYTPSDNDLFTTANPFSSNNVNCAVTVASDQPVVAIANEAPLTPGVIDNNNYEGFNLVP
jgi:hypothetical protein